MPQRDLYRILGVRRRADPAEIRRAYRRAVFTVHPDVGDRPDPEKFRELHEAYQVLSDPDRRRAYDVRVSGRPGRIRRPAAGPVDTSQSAESLQPLFDHFAERFFGFHTRRSGPHLVLRLRALLEPEEASFGCRVPLELRHYEECTQCSGLWWAECPLCGGAGAVERTTELIVDIPGGVQDGDRLEFELGSGDAGQYSVQVRISIRLGS
jgi:molecular chaperone DnaJ